ncbi:MAG: hypothetical protein AAGG44_09900 [Planctomycetota bacterium]
MHSTFPLLLTLADGLALRTFRAPASRLGPWARRLVLASVIAVGMVAVSEPVNAQLTVLSVGNRTLKWKETQLETLASQLESGKIEGQLKVELESQIRWLKSWEPKKLDVEPLWSEPTGKGRYVEPTLDPEKKATKLRRRLLGKDARPTVKDTRQLEKLLADYPSDIGIRQLHLHWLDQLQYRKDYADEIAEAAIRLAGLLDQVRPAQREVQVAKAFCLYRRGRALAYRELPDVVAKKPIEDPEAHEAALLGTHAQLTEMVGIGRPEFILLDIRILRRDRWYGQALGLLESNGELIQQKWFLKKRRDLLKELGWEEPAREAAAIYRAKYPDAVAKEEAAAP